jgi:hypothetical protein
MIRLFVEDKPDNYHPLLIDKKKIKQQFRKTYRIELVIKEINFKSKIMQTRTKNSIQRIGLVQSGHHHLIEN